MILANKALRKAKKPFIIVCTLLAIIIMMLAVMSKVSMLEASLYAFSIFAVCGASVALDRKAKAKAIK